MDYYGLSSKRGFDVVLQFTLMVFERAMRGKGPGDLGVHLVVISGKMKKLDFIM